MAKGGEIQYALTVTVPSAYAASEDPRSQTPVVDSVGSVPDAFAPDPALTEPAAVNMQEGDWRPHQERFLQAVAEEFGVTLPRHALLQGRLHSIETVDWSRAPREGDRWVSLKIG